MTIRLSIRTHKISNVAGLNYFFLIWNNQQKNSIGIPINAKKNPNKNMIYVIANNVTSDVRWLPHLVTYKNN